MKKIWICGSAGMLGSHFTRLLSKRKIPFVATNKSELDIGNVDAVADFARVQQISHIINCAAYTHVDLAESELAQAYKTNAKGIHHLALAAKQQGAHLLHFSTDYVFDGMGKVPYNEDHPCSPLGAYGMSKLAGEMKLLEEYKRACIIRTSWLFGFPGKNFVETMLRLMNEKEHLRVVADQIGRPTYCEDLAEAALELLEADGIYHFANAFETSWHGFAEEIRRQANDLGYPLKIQAIQPITTQEYPTPAQRPAYSTLGTNKIENELRRPPRPWREALRDYLIQRKESQ